MRQLAYEMNRNALSLASRQLGKRLPDSQVSAVERLGELHMPVLVIVGTRDIPYFLAAAEYMVEKIPSARKVIIEVAAHMPNVDHPLEFQRTVATFLDGLTL